MGEGGGSQFVIYTYEAAPMMPIEIWNPPRLLSRDSVTKMRICMRTVKHIWRTYNMHINHRVAAGAAEGKSIAGSDATVPLVYVLSTRQSCAADK